jgi:hypothetical protein
VETCTDASNSYSCLRLRLYRWTGTVWNQVGPFLYIPECTALLAIDPLGNPVVTWVHPSKKRVNFRRWNGGIWAWIPSMELPSRSTTGGAANFQIDALGRFVVVYGVSTPIDSPPYYLSGVYASRWDGSQWQQLGTELFKDNKRSFYAPDLRIDKNNVPFVAFITRQILGGCTEDIPCITNEDLYVRKWNGTRWTQVGSYIDSAGEKVNNPSLAFTPDGRPMIAYDESYRGNQNIYIKVLSYGGTWGYVGARVERNVANPAYLPSLAVDAAGNAIFSYQVNYETKGPGMEENVEAVYVRKFQP